MSTTINASPLRDRIAALETKSQSASPPQKPSASPSSLTRSPSKLRDKIARFEEKGGVPVPRGSFGLGAPPLQAASPQRKGELWGNRLPELSRPNVVPSLHSHSSSQHIDDASPERPSVLDRDTGKSRRTTLQFSPDSTPALQVLRTSASMMSLNSNEPRSTLNHNNPTTQLPSNHHDSVKRTPLEDQLSDAGCLADEVVALNKTISSKQTSEASEQADESTCSSIIQVQSGPDGDRQLLHISPKLEGSAYQEQLDEDENVPSCATNIREEKEPSIQSFPKVSSSCEQLTPFHVLAEDPQDGEESASELSTTDRGSAESSPSAEATAALESADERPHPLSNASTAHLARRRLNSYAHDTFTYSKDAPSSSTNYDKPLPSIMDSHIDLQRRPQKSVTTAAASPLARSMSTRKAPLPVPNWYDDDDEEENNGEAGWARVIVCTRQD